ncbi:MAG: MBL fold metallo-hydrolase [Gammaproteobacteria bacterium]|nr:MBL fold metallo-hydrolase [Gammaproteobacteria bacterium]
MREPIYKQRPVEPNPADFKAHKVHDFIVLCEAFSNNYLIMTAQGNIQINAGMAIEAPIIRQNFAAFSTQPTSHVILTQGHVDHVGGVAYLREQHPGLTVIAQAGNPEHQAYDGRLASFRASRSAFAFTQKFAAAFDNYARHGVTEFPTQDVPTPDVLVEDNLRLSVGGLALEVIAVPGAETNDSLIVWLPEQRICFTGNLFGCPFGHFPNLVTIRGDRYRDALTVAAAVERVRDLKPQMILYGHHGPVEGAELIERELDALHGAIHYVHDATVRGMNDGADVYTLMREIQLPPELEVGQGYGKVSWGVRAIWENYAGWFHHRSTTELYSVPFTSVHPDLLELAGGSTALVQRAREKLAAGQPEQALHLLDIALSGDDPAARAVAAQAHRALLQHSENFWLSAWLEQQIATLES